MKFKDPKFKHEIFMRIDMKYLYFSNISQFVCNKFFPLLKIIIELFVVCQKSMEGEIVDIAL